MNTLDCKATKEAMPLPAILSATSDQLIRNRLAI